MIKRSEPNQPGCDDAEDEPDIEEAWLREIDRRTAALDAGIAETVPWETVRARLRARGASVAPYKKA